MKWQAVIYNDSNQSIIQGYTYNQLKELLLILKYDCAIVVYPNGGFDYYNTKEDFMNYGHEEISEEW